ncbi:MAG: type IV pilin protein [Methylobacter sp.]|nr:type IV pilin protein [Methylobacter sp.]MDP2099518.1 type IV pilin protein [Methylobacter sp.]MDP2428670.1 type IV pilin protein [Methylobacter sp.]MDP3055145.1 type IV pilin protein [Methylobacter sp.]MDP3364216.1 type IV pilin protein [Methylobacter sp.]
MCGFKRGSGFTLIELMITVAIIGILSTIAYPAYTDYVIRAKRSDGKAALLQVQLAQEKWRANNTTYGTLANIGVAATSPDGHYTVAVSGNTATAYTATATPASPFVDAKCGALGINQAGDKTVSGSGLSAADCWGK